MNEIKHLIKLSNKLFTSILLTVFYVIFVGICWGVYQLVKVFSPAQKTESYWLTPKNSLKDQSYFSSGF